MRMSWSVADTACSIPERFEERARRNPAKVAIAGTDWEPTYAELDAGADRLAGELLARGAERGERVALLMRHDAPLIMAQLAVLKTGACLIVLNPGDPPARLERLRAETTPSLLVADSESCASALGAGFAEEAILVTSAPSQAPSTPIRRARVAPDDLALLICTSGSTGHPVAVMQTHRNVLHNVLRHTNELGLRCDDRIVLLASPSGGQGAGTVWTALLNGATLCPFPVVARGMTGLAGWLEETEVTVLVASASLFRHLTATLQGRELPRVRLVRLGSEQALGSDFETWRTNRFSRGCLLANTYSSSETGSIAHHLMDDSSSLGQGPLPAGRPAEGIEVRILDEAGRELGPEEAGEIVVRGAFLSPGYWRQEELTGSRFETDESALRMFRTGDLGVRDQAGVLTVLGRLDNLVKVRGNRISLSEVESALVTQPGVEEAAVLAVPNARGDVRLAAHVVTAQETADAQRLREALRRTLPEPAVPSTFAFHERLPLTAHGKVDRTRLSEEPGLSERCQDGLDLAAGEVEETIARLWSNALGHEQIGRGENYFDLGGDSLSAAETLVEIGTALGIEIPLEAFAAEPTVAGLARLTEALGDGAADPPAPLCRREPGAVIPATLAQERIWKLCTTPATIAGYIVVAQLDIRGPLDVAAFRGALEQIVARHESLRTSFVLEQGQLVQVVHAPETIDIQVHDFAAATDPSAEADALMREIVAEPFDLGRPPLLRLALIRLSAVEHRLHRINHHILSDGQSWGIFLDELARLYESRTRGSAAARPTQPELQYGDFAVWQRRLLRPGAPRRRRLLERARALGGVEASRPPFLRSAPEPGAAPDEGVIAWGLPPAVSAGLEHLARRAGVSYYMVRVAAFAALLAAESGNREVVLGSYSSARRLPATREMFGCFTHLAVLRLECRAGLSVSAWLEEVRARVLEMAETAEIPYEVLADELGQEGVALPGVQMLFGSTEVQPPRRIADIEISSPNIDLEQHMPWGFSFLVDPRNEHTGCRTLFDATLYDPVSARTFVERYRRLASELCGDSSRGVEELLDLSAAV